MKIFRIYDSKAESFSNPFYENTDASAMRAFVAAMQNPEGSGMRGHPIDYALVGIGDIEHDSALPVLVQPYTLMDGSTALAEARSLEDTTIKLHQLAAMPTESEEGANHEL